MTAPTRVRVDVNALRRAAAQNDAQATHLRHLIGEVERLTGERDRARSFSVACEEAVALANDLLEATLTRRGRIRRRLPRAIRRQLKTAHGNP